MAGQTEAQTQPAAKEEQQRLDQSVAQELKKLQVQFQDAFRRYRDLIGQSVCDDHARHLNNERIVLINEEIKQINSKQIALFKRFRRTKEARRMQLKLARRKRLESDIEERFSFHFSTRFQRHWDIALERLSLSDKNETVELKSLALFDILPKNVDKELRSLERDEPVAPLRTHLIKSLCREKGQANSRKRAARRTNASAGNSGEEGRPFKAPRCSKRIRGVSPTSEQDAAQASVMTSAASMTEVALGPAEGLARSQSAPAGDEKASEDLFSSVSPRVPDTQPKDLAPANGVALEPSAPSSRKAQSLDCGVKRRQFCCAFCRRIRRVSSSVWSDDGVLWCRRCRPSGAESSALDSNTDKSSSSVQGPSGVANGDDNTSHSTLSNNSISALQ